MPQTPDYLRPEVDAAQPSLQLIADLLGGSRAMHASPAVAAYLPQWPQEARETWMKRVQAATLYKGFERTLSASVGLLFGTPPTVSFEGAAALEAHAWNIDGQGNAFDVFAKRCAESAVANGYAVVVVDFPARPAVPVVTRATEQAFGLRPRWTYYHRRAVCSWRTATVNGQLVTTQLVLHEPTTADDGAYGIVALDRYRVLAVTDGVAGWTLWQKPATAGADWTVVDAGAYVNRRGEVRDTLPVAVAAVGRHEAPFVVQPPLEGVAEANLAHWRAKTELTWGSRLTAIEQPVIIGQLAPDATGQQPTSVPIGWDHVVNVMAGGDFRFVGPSGAGLTALKERMLEAEREIAALGLSFLARDTRAAETAEAKRLDATAENATLATAATGLEDAFNLAWEHHAWFEGLPAAAAPTVAMTRDFERLTLDAARATFIAALVAEGFPIRDAVQMLAVGGLLHTTDAAELDRIAAEWAGGADAAAELTRLATEAQLRRPALPPAA